MASKSQAYRLPVGPGSASVSAGQAWATVAMLSLLTIVSFVDRQILAVLVGDMQGELRLSDVQFGILLGPAFIVTYNIALIVLAVLVDRWNRKYLLVAGILLWSTMTFLSALATDFNQLVVLRSGLAIGEALLGPTTVALIGDMFRRDDRAAPMALYIAGSIIGQNGAAFFGAAALQAAGDTGLIMPFIGSLTAWRTALVFVAIPGFILGVAFLLVAREPVRGATAVGDAEQARERETLRAHLARHWPVYAMLPVAMGTLNMLAVSLALWGPAFLARGFAQTPVASGYIIGSVSIVAGCAGCLLLPLLMRWRKRFSGVSVGMVDIALVATLIAVPSLWLFGHATTLNVAIAGLAVAVLALTSTFSLVSQFVQLRTPSRLRAKIMAGMLFFVFLISAGIGPVLVPAVANRLTGSRALGEAIALLAVASLLVVLPLLIGLRRRLAREHREEGAAG